MDRRPFGRPGLSEALTACAHKWAEQSCMDQQLSLRITDAKTLARVAQLLGGPSAGRPPVYPAPAPGGPAARSAT
jgi:hypothetical protein